MRITRTPSFTADGLVFDEAEANAHGIHIEADDAEHDHPLLRAARLGHHELADVETAWAA